MTAQVDADPGFLNRFAWNHRWSDRRRSTDAATKALDLAGTPQGVRREKAAAHRTLAWQAKWRGDFDQAMKHALACETEVTEDEAPDLRGDCYAILGVIHYSRHRMSLAVDSVERGLGLVHLPEDSWIDLMTTLATIQRYQGRSGKSGLTLMRARDRAKGAELARVEHNIARWLSQQDDPEGALKHADRSIALSEDFANRVILPYACEIAGSSAATLGKEDDAAAHFNRGISLAIEDDDMRALCQVLHCSATFEASHGRDTKALDQLVYGARIARDMNYPLWSKKFALSLAAVLEKKGDLAGAIEAHKEAWKYQNTLSDDSIGARPRSD